jgi:hypothetical protein
MITMAVMSVGIFYSFYALQAVRDEDFPLFQEK